MRRLGDLPQLTKQLFGPGAAHLAFDPEATEQVEDLGRTGFLAAGFALVAASACAVVAGLLLWCGQRRGVQLGLLVDPVSFALGIGFALPVLLIGVPVRVGLVLVGSWQARRGDLEAARQP